MRVLLALNSLGIGGTETYVFTVAEHLDRLAHEPVIYAAEPGRGAQVADERGLEVIGSRELGDDFDVALVQDAAVGYEVAERCPRARSVFVAHSESFDPQSPPQLAGTVDLQVAMNDRVERRLRAFAAGCEIVRLRQPIDTDRFKSPRPLPAKPKRALVLSNNPMVDRQAMLEEACSEAGLELVRAGGNGRQTNDPRVAIMAADVVIGLGRGILEAMACGRAAFVYDWSGGEGWVTPTSYPKIEADGFAGRGETIFDAAGLAEALAGYDHSMGAVNRDLVVAHHRANVHVQELVEIFRRLAPPKERASAPYADMARLVRLEWRARAEVHGVRGENALLHAQLHEANEELHAARTGQLKLEQEKGAIVKSYESTLSWRLTRPLRRLAAWRKRGHAAP
ncbi:MAG: glycosyltransferase [Solirubrobacterales bacterium]